MGEGSIRTEVPPAARTSRAARPPVATAVLGRRIEQASSEGVLGGLLEDFGRIFNRPPVQPSADVRARLVADAIPRGSRRVVLWVGGTNDHRTNPAFAAAVRSRMPGVPLVRVPYQATWRFHDSVPDGVDVLRRVLDLLRRERPDLEVLVGGESQGAWIAGDVTAREPYRSQVSRVVLFGHPGVAGTHYHQPNGRVREYNNPRDVTAVDPGTQARRVIDGIDDLARGNLLSSLGSLLRAGIADSGLMRRLVDSQLFRLEAGATSPHDYSRQVALGVAYLATTPSEPGGSGRRLRAASRSASP